MSKEAKRLHAYYLLHKEEINARSRAWKKANRERKLKADRIRRKLPAARAHRRDYERSVKEEVLGHYGGKCYCCGLADLRFLTIDHKNGGGRAHRRRIKRRNIYFWLRTQGYPEGYRAACFNCNCGAVRNGGQCPHLQSLELAA